MLKWFPANADLTKQWGGPERATVDFTQPLVTQLVRDDRVIIRIRIQDEPYDVWDSKGLPGRPLLLPREMHARMYIEAGQFTERRRIEEALGVITRFVRNKGDKVPDVRYEGFDTPKDMILWEVVVATPEGEQELVEVRPCYVYPQKESYNADCAAIGCFVYLHYLPSKIVKQKTREKKLEPEVPPENLE